MAKEDSVLDGINGNQDMVDDRENRMAANQELYKNIGSRKNTGASGKGSAHASGKGASVK